MTGKMGKKAIIMRTPQLRRREHSERPRFSTMKCITAVSWGGREGGREGEKARR